MGFGFENMTVLDYAKIQCNVIVPYYLKLSFWPHPLVLDYGWPTAKGFAELVPHAAVLVGLLAGTLAASKVRVRW